MEKQTCRWKMEINKAYGFFGATFHAWEVYKHNRLLYILFRYQLSEIINITMRKYHPFHTVLHALAIVIRWTVVIILTCLRF